MKKKTLYSKLMATVLAIGFILTSCTDFLDTPLPNDQLATETVFQSKETIRDVVNGMYAAFSAQHNGFIIRNNAACADEGTLPSNPGSALGDMVYGIFTPQNGVMLPWETLYKSIYRANLILENLPEVPPTILNEADRKIYMAAARFVRAETHFYLVNTWGNVPLVTSTDATLNAAILQTPATEVMQQVVSDLEAAVADLPATVTNAYTINNKFQAQALLARVYLYLGRWADAEAAASGVISSGKYQMVSVLGDVFKKGSAESIFSLAETSTSRLYVNRASLGWLSLPTSAAGTLTSNPYIPDQVLSNVEKGDQRWVNGNWVALQYTKSYQNKYRHNTLAADAAIAAYPQAYILLRYSEQFLIRAEARAQLNKITEAAADLDVVRKRAGLPNTTAADKAALLSAVETERQYELFYEGHRWFDLARTNRLDAVVGTLPWKKDNWKSTYKVLPIPEKEMIINPKLVQNPGY